MKEYETTYGFHCCEIKVNEQSYGCCLKGPWRYHYIITFNGGYANIMVDFNKSLDEQILFKLSGILWSYIRGDKELFLRNTELLADGHIFLGVCKRYVYVVVRIEDFEQIWSMIQELVEEGLTVYSKKHSKHYKSKYEVANESPGLHIRLAQSS